MGRDARQELLEELADLYAVKLALLLVPVRQMLRLSHGHELAATVERLVVDVVTELEPLLARYGITRDTPVLGGEESCGD